MPATTGEWSCHVAWFTDGRATEAPVNPLLPGRGEDKMREVALDIGLGSGAGAFEAAKAFHLVADELIIGRVLKRRELTREGMDRRRPETSAVTATCSRLIGLTVAKPAGSQPIEPGPADPELSGSVSCIQQPRVEVFEGSLDELRWQAMESLLLFKSASSTAQTDLRNQIVEHPARCLFLNRPRQSIPSVPAAKKRRVQKRVALLTGVPAASPPSSGAGNRGKVPQKAPGRFPGARRDSRERPDPPRSIRRRFSKTAGCLRRAD